MKTNKIDKQGYWHHNHAVSKCMYHIVFCTKYRRKVLSDKMQRTFKKLIKGKQKEWIFKILAMETMEDHIHILLQCDPSIGVNNLVAKIKGYTANRLRQKFPELKSRLPSLWTRGRFIGSVGTKKLDVIKTYVENQKNV